MPTVPPISNVDSIDVTGVRKEGGIDLVISTYGPLDGGLETLRLISTKVRGYVAAVESGNLFARFDARPGPIRIIISCAHAIDPAARALIARLNGEAAKRGTSVEVRPTVV